MLCLMVFLILYYYNFKNRMGQPLETCCNPANAQIISDMQIKPLASQAIKSVKIEVNIAQLIKKRQQPLLQTLKKARKNTKSQHLPTNEEDQKTCAVEIVDKNQKMDWVVFKGSQIGKEISGQMTIYFPNGEIFQGKMIKNQPTFGIYIFKKDCYYFGDISDFNAEGRGKYQNKDLGYTYEGSFSKGLPHGQGKQTCKNGDTYQGQLMYGQKFGHGVYHFSDGKVYTGQFYYNQSDGHGKIVYNDGSYYEGEWKLGKFNGFGKFVWNNGEKYEGHYQDGLRHGKGKYTFKSRGWYEGEWQFGLQSGSGKYCQGFDTIEGKWKEGQFLG